MPGGDLTWDHVQVVVQQVGVAGGEGEEDRGVGSPGDDPDGQEGETASPEPPLHLGGQYLLSEENW